MRNRFLLLVWLLFSATNLLAQIGINTTTPNAQLEIKSSNEAIPANTDGLLIPKVNIFPATNPTAAQQGMMVYLTTVSGTDLPGFYYWDNLTTSWVGVGKNTSNAWSLTGNAATNATTNFIGTTDNVDLVFRRANVQSGRIGTSNTFLGRLSGSVATGVNNTYMGTEAGRDNITGQQNVFIGRRAGTFGTSGTDNVLIGNGAGILNEANQNCFLGSFSGNGNTTGANNSFYGYSSGMNTGTGSQNVFLGTFAGNANTIGIGNTSIGTNSNVNSNNLNNASAIGFNAMVGASNSMVLGSISGLNSATASTAVAIGTTSPTAALEVASTSRGVLIPRVALLALNLQSPIANPQGGALPESTLVYNTATAGVSPNNVYPGFYYWDSSKWVRFDVNGENNPKYYTAVGTTDTSAPVSFGNMAQMSMTFTPKDDVVLVNFSAAGRRGDDSCQNNAIFFQLLLNGVPVTGWQTASKQGIVDVPFTPDDITIWDTNFTYPVNVTIGVSQTIQIQWSAPNCSMLNSPANPLSAFGVVFKSYRSLTVIDPNGGGGIVGSPPVTTNQWALNGNSGTNSALNFVGTSDAQSLVLKSNNIEGIRIGTTGNVGIGTPTPLDKLHITGSIRMVDGNQAVGKVLTSDANGTANWQTLPANNWSLTGNAGTNPATNFIGTTDDNDMVFRRFNIRGGVIGTTNTSFGLNALNPAGTGTNNTAIGSGSLDTNTTGSDNMSAGFNTLTNNTSGSNNTAIGVAAMVSNTTGVFNTAIGRSVLFDNTTGNNNSGLGYNALGNVTTGSNNTAIGYNSFAGINVGNNNTGLGAETSTTSTLFENATAVGYRATVGNSNVMVLGSISGVNGATASVNVGIGTVSPQTALEVVDANVVTSATTEGTVNVMTNGAQSIDAGGSLSLGGTTTDAGTTFRTFGTIEGRKANATTGSSSGYLVFKTNNAGVLGERMRITAVGDVGIGTAAPGGQFELSLNEGRKPTSNTWTIPSDARLKEVHGAYEKGLSEIRQLRTVRYHYKNTDKKTFDSKVLNKEAYGFLAQEVQPLFPEAVGTDADGYLNFDLHPILIASINALKELDAKNNQLQKDNEALKAQLSEQQKKLEYLISEIEKIKKK